VTTHTRRFVVFVEALACISLALILAAEAATPASSQSSRRRRAARATVDQEFLIQPSVWLALRPVWLPPGADLKPPAAPPLVAETLVILDLAGTPPPTPVRGGHGSTGIPKLLPPFPPAPASPIR
jgi:hypothetical protein